MSVVVLIVPVAASEMVRFSGWSWADASGARDAAARRRARRTLAKKASGDLGEGSIMGSLE
jgi:hypothetical protein